MSLSAKIALVVIGLALCIGVSAFALFFNKIITIPATGNEFFDFASFTPELSLIVFAGASLLLSCIAILVLRNSIVRPLREITTTAESVASGELKTIASITSHDEIGTLAHSFNATIDKIKELTGALEKKVAAKSDELSEKVKIIEEQNRVLEDTKKVLLRSLNEARSEKERLAEEKAKDELLLESIGEGIIAVNELGNLILLNKAAETMLGIDSKMVIGKHHSEVLHIADANNAVLPENAQPITLSLVTNKKISTDPQITNYCITSEGKKFPVSLIASPLSLKEKKMGAIIALHDITKEKEIEQAKSDFVSIASHQLRTPLSIINWYLEMLLDNKDVLNDDQKKYIQEINKGNQRMIKLVADLLNISRLEMKVLPKEKEMIDIVRLINEVVEDLAQDSDQKHQTLEQKFSDKKIVLESNNDLLHIVIENLISNAIKYTPPEGVITVAVDDSPSEITITVQDTGYGIPTAQQQKVFSKFFRGDNIRDKETVGTGLGLYIVKLIIDAMAGTIRFVSTENKGTTFFITLPKKTDTQSKE